MPANDDDGDLDMALGETDFGQENRRGPTVLLQEVMHLIGAKMMRGTSTRGSTSQTTATISH